MQILKLNLVCLECLVKICSVKFSWITLQSILVAWKSDFDSNVLIKLLDSRVARINPSLWSSFYIHCYTDGDASVTNLMHLYLACVRQGNFGNSIMISFHLLYCSWQVAEFLRWQQPFKRRFWSSNHLLVSFKLIKST